jgi:hypothetical protein
VDWQTQEETLALAKEFDQDTKELAGLCGNDLTERLKTVVAVRYAALLHGWNGEITDEMREKFRGMKGLTREIVRLRRCDQEFEQMKLEREIVEMKKQQTEEGIRKKFEEWAADTDFQEEITPKMTKEEKDRALYRLIYGRDKEEVEREKAEAKAKRKAQSTVESKGSGVGGRVQKTGTGTVPEPAGGDPCATPNDAAGRPSQGCDATSGKTTDSGGGI